MEVFRSLLVTLWLESWNFAKSYEHEIALIKKKIVNNCWLDIYKTIIWVKLYSKREMESSLMLLPESENKINLTLNKSSQSCNKHTGQLLNISPDI